MPTGIIILALSVAMGGVVGAYGGQYLSTELKDNLNMVFGVCAMAMGVASIANMVNMPAVIFSVVAGTAIGTALHVGDRISRACMWLGQKVGGILPQKNDVLPKAEYQEMLITATVLFCASGTGIYGAIVSGMTGDQSILLSKAILDFFTAMVIACVLGIVVSFLAVPQFIVLIILFLLAGIIYPLTSQTMISDFRACGGILLLATGFRMIKVKMFPIADMLLAMVLVMPVSWFWTSCIAPLL